MDSEPGLVRCEEAQQFLDELNDPITKNLVNMAYVSLIKKCYFGKDEKPATNFDALFFVETLSEFFSEHEVLERTLAGEKVGAWFEEPT